MKYTNLNLPYNPNPFDRKLARKWCNQNGYTLLKIEVQDLTELMIDSFIVETEEGPKFQLIVDDRNQIIDTIKLKS